jgi:hypothetical protein
MKKKKRNEKKKQKGKEKKLLLARNGKRDAIVELVMLVTYTGDPGAWIRFRFESLRYPCTSAVTSSHYRLPPDRGAAA